MKLWLLPPLAMGIGMLVLMIADVIIDDVFYEGRVRAALCLFAAAMVWLLAGLAAQVALS